MDLPPFGCSLGSLNFLFRVLRTGSETLTSLVLPPHCAGCGADTGAGVHLCGTCASHLPRLEAPFCHRCSQPFTGAITGDFTCDNCLNRHLHFRFAVAAYRSQGLVRDFIHRFKYDGHFYLATTLAGWLADSLADPRLQSPPVDAIVPVPLHPVRQREREFNQAAVLANLVSKACKTPIISALQRVRYTSTQTRLDRQHRMENLRGAFRLSQSAPVLNRHLLIVDDVLTTGSTVNECAMVLLAGGAASVRVATVARG